MGAYRDKPTQTFAHKTVFLTGGTGFFGKVAAALVEKLLRSAPSVTKIFVLIRARGDASACQRLEQELIASPIFDRLRQELGSVEVADAFLRSKLTAVTGDVTSPQLGLSADDQLLLQQSVQISIHSAATVQFNEPLDVAVRMNCRGAINVIDFVQTCPHVVCHMHVSTAYVNSNLRGDKVTVQEQLYPLAFDVEEAFVAVSKASPGELEKLHARLIGDYPNTYTLTKSMAEHLIIKRAGAKTPLTIFRPAVISASWKDPVPGWIDQVAGVGALFVAVGRGALTVFPGDPTGVANVVPVDLAVNTALVSVARVVATHMEDPHGLPSPLIVHSSTSDPRQHPLYWEVPTRVVPEYFRENPSAGELFPVNYRMITHQPRFRVEWFIRYTLPSVVYSTIAIISGSAFHQHRAVQLEKLTRRMQKLIAIFKPFSDTQWIFKADSLPQLELHATDPTSDWWLDAKQIEWESYLISFCAGLERFALRERSSTATERSKYKTRTTTTKPESA